MTKPSRTTVPTSLPLLAAGLLALTVPATGCIGVGGSGTLAKETRNVDDFHAVEVGGAFEVETEVGPAVTVTVIGDDNLLPYLTTEVHDGRLRIGQTKSLRPRAGLTVLLTTPRLDGLEVSGATDATVRGIETERFDLEVSGAGDVELSGQVTRLNVEISGAGDLHARALEAQSVHVELSGAGEAEVSAAERLEVDVSGAGDVDYWGDPEVVSDISGAGSIERKG
jgi:hypothetical protein